MVEAYSREESSHGWWPASQPPGPAFYAYTYPEPDGYRAAQVLPPGAAFDPGLGEFLLPYDNVRDQANPDAAVLAFLQSTYEAGAGLAGWDRGVLEPRIVPQAPADRPWSVGDPDTIGLGQEAARDAAKPAHRHHARRSRADDR
jgi:hypothetical protein